MLDPSLAQPHNIDRKTKSSVAKGRNSAATMRERERGLVVEVEGKGFSVLLLSRTESQPLKFTSALCCIKLEKKCRCPYFI